MPLKSTIIPQLTIGALNTIVGAATSFAIVDTPGTRFLSIDTTNGVVAGYRAGEGLTTGNGVVIGTNAARNLTSGTVNVVIGEEAFFTATTAQQSVAVGYKALFAATTVGNNVAVGWSAGAAATGGNNVFVGWGAGGTVTTGTNNTCVGRVAGNNVLTTGSRNTLIGDAASPSAAGVNDEITIGGSTTTAFRVPGVGFEIVQTGTGGIAAVATPAAKLVRFASGSGTDNAAGNVTITAPLSTGNATPASIIFQVGQQVGGSSSTVQTAGAALTLAHTTAGGHLATFSNKVTAATVNATAFSVGGTPGASGSGTVLTALTVVNGLVTAITIG